MTPIPNEILQKVVQNHPELARQLNGNANSIDVGGCGYGSAEMAPQGGVATVQGGSPAVNMRGKDCPVVVNAVTFGVQLAVDQNGTIYTRSSIDDGGGTQVPNLITQGDRILIDFDFAAGGAGGSGGYLQIYGINAQLLAGTEAVLDALQNQADLQRTNSTSISIYETTGCWCPFEASVISGQSQLVLEAHAVPSHTDTSVAAGGVFVDGAASTASLFLSSFTLNFLGVLVRSIGGGCLVSPLAELPAYK